MLQGTKMKNSSQFGFLTSIFPFGILSARC
nr:MAG TPA: hypothetical protein [Caudoviricetes sp.]